MFQGQLRRNPEVYVDDMVVKFDDITTHLVDLKEVFWPAQKVQHEVEPQKSVSLG